MGDELAVNLGNRGPLYHPDYPNNWERRPLYSMANWVNGLAFRNVQFSRSGMPVIKIAEIKGGISGQTKFTEQVFDDSVHVRAGDLLFSWSGQPETSIDAFWWRGPDGWLNQHVFRVTPAKGIDSVFFYYLLRYLKPSFVGIARNKQTTGLGHVTKNDLKNIEGAHPAGLGEQRAIADILGTLDDKIELNRQMNCTLEVMTRAIFKAWFVDFEPVKAKAAGSASFHSMPQPVFDQLPDRLTDTELGPVPEGWEIKRLDEIADFLNGLALQKYPATASDDSLPVIKIAELRNGISAKSGRASRELPEKYVVHDGDFLFSWSGSLLAKFWTEGEGALNQHLFKVTSETYPMWFVSQWVQHHLEAFQAIAAAKATTMGHIQRRHLKEAMTVCPPNDVLKDMSTAMSPLVDKMVSAEIESRTLAALRDTLLPKLFSGELRVSVAEGDTDAD